MTLDASGNLLVGTTVAPNTLAGASATQGVAANGGTGYLVAAASGTATAYFNRQSTDGDIVSFRKDGAPVGSIGAKNSVLLIGSGATGLMFESGGDDIIPRNTNGNNSNGSTDLGSDTSRFKDLYLSGGVVFGATGGDVTSKTLDDYEEGTWTPSLENVTVSYTSRSGTYTKIGRLVFATMDMDVSSLDTSDVSGFTVTLPFAAPTGGDKSALFSASIKYNESNALVPTGNTDFLNSGGKVNGSTMNIRAPYETGGGTDPTYASLNSSGSIIFSIMYYAA
jgi:hypothetical protein